LLADDVVRKFKLEQSVFDLRNSRKLKWKKAFPACFSTLFRMQFAI
jgi:hypothetical protein